MKFEAKVHTEETPTYGVWNNDMKSWQKIEEWDYTTQTEFFNLAEQKAMQLNNKFETLTK